MDTPAKGPGALMLISPGVLVRPEILWVMYDGGEPERQDGVVKGFSIAFQTFSNPIRSNIENSRSPATPRSPCTPENGFARARARVTAPSGAGARGGASGRVGGTVRVGAGDEVNSHGRGVGRRRRVERSKGGESFLK